jgi:hypothetical protein
MRPNLGITASLIVDLLRLVNPEVISERSHVDHPREIPRRLGRPVDLRQGIARG